MELDKRIKEGKRPLMCFDIEEAEQFIGKNGYFSDCLYKFQNLDDCSKSILHCVDDKCGDSNDYLFNDGKYYCRFFLPVEWVKEPEKKYRPYTVMEFIKEYPLGSHLHFRPKDKLIEMHRLIDGYNDCLNGAGTLFICGAMYSMRELYDNYDIFRDGEWQPFGVVDEGE